MFTLAVLLLIFSPICVSPAAVVWKAKMDGNENWWKSTVFYQIYTRSFKDSNNDGVGDLQGITDKLQHIKDAGVGAICISSVYKSLQADLGYDVLDFKDIDNLFGTVKDFDYLLLKAHELGIKVIMDFIPNHSSNEHEWFRKSHNREVGFEDFYVWKDGDPDKPPNNWLSVYGGSAWTYSDIRKQYYLHQFLPQQPDLNYRNIDVIDKMNEVLFYWLDKGVDGFIITGAQYLLEDEYFVDEPLSGNPNAAPWEYESLDHIYTSDQLGTFNIIYEWRNHVDSYTERFGGDARILITDAQTNLKNTVQYYGDGNYKGAHFNFNYQFLTSIGKWSHSEYLYMSIEDWLKHLPTEYSSNWMLGNHNNHRVASRLGPKNVDAMNMLAALLPGVMVTYNGEEIGQENGDVTWDEGHDEQACMLDPDDFYRKSRDFERTPFHWNDAVNAGFNEGQRPWLPVSWKYKEINLAFQSNTHYSHYSIYKQLLDLRQQKAFVEGQLLIDILGSDVLGFTRELNENDSYAVIINFSDTMERANLTAHFKTFQKEVVVVIPNLYSKKNQNEVLHASEIILGPYESIVLRVLPDKENPPDPEEPEEPNGGTQNGTLFYYDSVNMTYSRKRVFMLRV